jgi:aldose 1-epimerase
MARAFGTTPSGATGEAVDLRAGSMVATVLTYCAILRHISLTPEGHNLTWGSDSLGDYATGMRYHGALIGPVANRISGASAQIGARHYTFDANQEGAITLHSGAKGTFQSLWTLAEEGPSHAVLTLDLADGEGGFPGNRQITARYDLEPDRLRLTLDVTTDALTPVNLANHSYWNLDGSQSFEGHQLRIAADHHLPVTKAVTPTGEIAPVAGTGFDFRTSRKLSGGAPPLDTNFCLSKKREPLRDVLWLTGQDGITMTLATTEPGLQIYDSRPDYRALAIEAQYWPDALANPAFPSILLGPAEPWQQVTEWRFSTGPR